MSLKSLNLKAMEKLNYLLLDVVPVVYMSMHACVLALVGVCVSHSILALSVLSDISVVVCVSTE